MTDKQIIIDDQKKTIHRLQDECTEKTNAIIALGEQLKAKEQECEELKNTVMQKCPQCGEIYLNPIGAKLYETLTEIKEIVEQASEDYRMPEEEWNKILQKISEVEE